MAASIPVEEEHGTFTRAPRRHNGYYAGDFSVYPVDRPIAALPTTHPHPRGARFGARPASD